MKTFETHIHEHPLGSGGGEGEEEEHISVLCDPDVNQRDRNARCFPDRRFHGGEVTAEARGGSTADAVVDARFFFFPLPPRLSSSCGRNWISGGETRGSGQGGREGGASDYVKCGGI